MPVGLRRTISEMEEFEQNDEDDDGSRERDVHFFLPNSRRQSEEESALNSRPRAYGMSQDCATNFLLFHTFQLASQTGPSQVAVLPATKSTGVRILAACRDDTFRCFYFELDDSGDEVRVTPRARLINFLPVEKEWKVGALSCLPKRPSNLASGDLVAYSVYRPPKDQLESELSGTSWLALALVPEPGDPDFDCDFKKAERSAAGGDDRENGDDGSPRRYCDCRLSFTLNGCNPLTWWTSLHAENDEPVSLLISGQDEILYSVSVEPGRLPEEPVYFSAFDAIPELKSLSHVGSVNAWEYLDVMAETGQQTRVMAISHKSRSEIVVGTLDCSTAEWTLLWTAQHDSMTSRMQLFKNGDNLDLLVIGLCEAVVVYRNILSPTKPPKPIVLPDSNRDDVVTCCHVADVDHDGQLEILLGTYNRAVLIYKLNDLDAGLFQRLETAFPVHYVAMVSLTNGLLPELLVITQKGVHVYGLFS